MGSGKVEKGKGNGGGGGSRHGGAAFTGCFRRWLVRTFGLDLLCSGSGVLDVAGGRGQLSFELVNLHACPSTVFDPRSAASINYAKLVKQHKYIVARTRIAKWKQRLKEQREEEPPQTQTQTQTRGQGDAAGRQLDAWEAEWGAGAPRELENGKFFVDPATIAFELPRHIVRYWERTGAAAGEAKYDLWGTLGRKPETAAKGGGEGEGEGAAGAAEAARRERDSWKKSVYGHQLTAVRAVVPAVSGGRGGVEGGGEGGLQCWHCGGQHKEFECPQKRNSRDAMHPEEVTADADVALLLDRCSVVVGLHPDQATG